MKFEGKHANKDMIFLIHPRLASLMFYVEFELKRLGFEAIWTSIIRPKLEDSGIHADYRAADLSIREIGLQRAITLCEKINGNPCFIYMPISGKYKTALLNDGHSYGGQQVANHIHLQVNRWF